MDSDIRMFKAGNLPIIHGSECRCFYRRSRQQSRDTADFGNSIGSSIANSAEFAMVLQQLLPIQYNEIYLISLFKMNSNPFSKSLPDSTYARNTSRATLHYLITGSFGHVVEKNALESHTYPCRSDTTRELNLRLHQSGTWLPPSFMKASLVKDRVVMASVAPKREAPVQAA